MRTLIVFIIINCLAISNSQSCTIFYAFRNGIILAGNNEDWEDPAPMMFIYPGGANKNGWIKFGWGSGFPQGGMNEKGLFWDATAGPYLAMPESEANKTFYSGALMQKVIEECANTSQASAVFKDYYCQDQYKAQYLIGDSSGHSMIVEGDNIIRNDFDIQVLTNFYQSHPELGGYPCTRYEAAMQILDTCKNLSPYLAGFILATTHQEGRYPTQYSNIYDLRNGLIYLFYYHNFQEFITIDLHEQINNGYQSYNIPDLFSKIYLLSPTDKEALSSTSVDIKWKGMPGSYYELIYSRNPDFSDPESEIVLSHSAILVQEGFNRSLLLVILPFSLLISLNIFYPNKKSLSLVLVLAATFIFSRCKKETTTIDEDGTIEFVKTLDGLYPDTRYYWKINASTGHSVYLNSETITHSFTTGSE